MPRGLSAPQKTELGLTAFASPVYCVRIRRKDGTFLRWSEQNPTFNDGTPSQTYEPRIINIGGFQFSPDEAAAITITVANVDGQITTLDRAESFAGESCEILAYLPGIDSYYIPWAGFCDEITEMSAESATLTAHPAVSNPHVQLPQRTIGIPCTHVFGHTASWVNFKDFEGAECPYQRVSTVGFTAVLVGAINNSVTSITIDWTAGQVTAGAKFKKNDVIKIDSEKMLVTNDPADPDGSGNQALTVTRGYQSTTPASHADLATVLFSNCQYDTVACTRRGMYGNNSADTYAAGAKKRNYFGGFPFVSGWQFGNFRSKAGERAKPLRLVFSGNESAYGRTLPLVYGKARLSDPVLLLVKPEGDFLTTLWAVCEGLLATNTTDDDQTTPSNAYVKTSGVENIYVNGVSRHDPRPGFGIESYNGQQDQPEPGSAFITGIADFSTNNLGFWGTARVVFRINTKNNPSVDVQGQSITGVFEIAFGRVVRVYSDTVTFARKATTIPAWVLMDLMTAKRAGGGLDHSRLNIQSFLDLASHCDTNVTSTFDGSTVKRWTFNGVIDTRQGYAEWIHRVCISCYALPPFMDKDGKLKVKALKSETLSGLPLFSSKVASTTARNIIWDGPRSSLMKQRRPISEIPNEIRVNYVDKSDYAKVSLTVADRDSQTDLGLKLGDNSRRAITKSIDLPGVSTLDEAARIATLILRAGEFGQGGLSNNLKVTFKAFYRDAEDLEIGDIVEVEDDLLSAANGEQYFRVVRISNDPMPMETQSGGIVFTKEIEAVLHANAIYDDTSLTVSKFDRIDAPYPSDAEVPAVTSFGVAEGGIWDTNNKPMTELTFTWTDPSPKQNYKCVALHTTEDDGAGNPVEGAWQFVADLYASGEIIKNFPVTNTRKHFCAVSRALSGHAMDIGTLTAAGAFKYPRASAIIDGITDTLPAPGSPQIFIGSGVVSLKWNHYTGNDLKLFRRFRVYRNTVNDLGTATLIAEPDANLFIDSSVAAATTYYYWIKGYSILNAEGTATAALSTTSPSNAGTDTGVPDTPGAVGFVRNYSSNVPNEYEWGLGLDKPGGAANWNTVNLAHLQVATDSGFSSLVLDREMSITEKAYVVFRANKPGTYYFRWRVKNAFGFSSYSATATDTTTITDANTADTDLIAAATLTIAVAATKTYLGGNEFELEFNVPATNATGYWGYTLIGYTSATLPTATTDETGTAGVVVSGVAQLTDSSKAWSVNAYANKDVVIFSTKRGGSPTWDYEGVIYIAKILSNTATVLTFDLPTNRVHHDLTGLKYYIVTPGNHFYDKVSMHLVFTDEGVTSPTDQRSGKRRIHISAATPTMHFWLALNNLWGHGKVQGTGSTATFAGMTTAQIFGTAAGAGAVTAIKTNVVNLGDITLNLGTVQTGLLRTASSGARIEIDSTNGLRSYDTGGTNLTQIAVSGGDAGKIFTTAVQGKTASPGLALGDDTLNVSLILGSSQAQFAMASTNYLKISSAGTEAQNSTSFICNNGQGLKNASANASVALPSGAVELYSGAGTLAMQDNGTDFFVQSSRTLKFGTHTAIGAETITGYITVKDAGGTSRKLAVVS